MRRAPSLAFAAILGCALSSAAPAEETRHPRTTADFAAALEHSKRDYVFESLSSDGYAAALQTMWPKAPVAPCLEVARSKGARKVRVCADPAGGARAELAEGERLFAKHDFAAARAHYVAALQKDPNACSLHLYLGDADLGAGQLAQAVADYEDAIRCEPADHRGYLYRAQALMRLRRYQAARDDLVRTLARAPHHAAAERLATSAAVEMGIDPHLEPFAPHAAVERGGKGDVRVRVETGGVDWMAFAICKAYWLGEVPATSPWSTAQDYECLSNLLGAYSEERRTGKAALEPQLERLLAISKSGLLPAFIVYELVARSHPEAPLLLSDDERDRVEKYVADWVLPCRAGGPASSH